MQLNDDFSARAVMHGAGLAWTESPTPGVSRRMLFRIGDEKARATSIVRYAPDSHFPRHGHPGGEEILVLDGVFQDESGDYPAGSYIRNPPGSAHSPASKPGCVLFVHLWQFRKDDHENVVRPSGSKGVLFDNGHEQVRIEQWRAGGTVRLENPRGLELLVLEGGFNDGAEDFTAQSWARLPEGMALNAQVGAAGATVWLKEGRLPQDNLCEFAR